VAAPVFDDPFATFTTLDAAFPIDHGDHLHYAGAEGKTACGRSMVPDGLTEDVARVWCGSCRWTYAWRAAASALLSSSPTLPSAPASTTTH
jgi:hypothetical protein